MQSIRTIGAALLICLIAAGCAGQDWREISTGLINASGETDTQTIAAGLKEALRVGSRRAVQKASKEGGYMENPEIRIPLPSRLQGMADTLEKVGMAGQIKTLEKKMNTAAEEAAGQAAPVFIDAISDMSISDARRILGGGPSAATNYLREKTSEELRSRYKPIVQEKLKSVGVVDLYNSLHDRYRKLPATPSVEFTPQDYATDQALDGLFQLLAGEEKRIRNDPAARTTDLLKQVFGG